MCSFSAKHSAPIRRKTARTNELFQNVAHKMDLRTAVEQGILAPIRCVRVKTDIDLSDVRIHGIKYDAQDLESKLFVPERNELIVNTYLKYARGKKAVVFCTSVNHAAEIARLLKEAGVNAEGISGSIKVSERNSILQRYEHGNNVCASRKMSSLCRQPSAIFLRKTARTQH